jgi:hypothetical protein
VHKHVDVPAVSTSARVNKDNIIEMFKNNGINTYDYVDYRGNKVVITRPFGFINEPKNKNRRVDHRRRRRRRSEDED